MTTRTLPTEPLGAERRDLLPHLGALDTAAEQAHGWDVEQARQLFLRMAEVAHP